MSLWVIFHGFGFSDHQVPVTPSLSFLELLSPSVTNKMAPNKGNVFSLEARNQDVCLAVLSLLASSRGYFLASFSLSRPQAFLGLQLRQFHLSSTIVWSSPPVCLSLASLTKTQLYWTRRPLSSCVTSS